MGNTIRRQPVNFNIPNSPNYKFLNITDFKGLNITDNPFTGEPETASDLLNLYVDEQNTLTTRPRIQKKFDLKESAIIPEDATIISVNCVDDKYLVQYKYNDEVCVFWLIPTKDGYDYQRIEINKSDTCSPIGESKIQIVKYKNYYVFVDGVSYKIIDNNVVCDASEKAYIPLTKIAKDIDAPMSGKDFESPNILTSKYRESYGSNYDVKTPNQFRNIDFGLLYGKELSLTGALGESYDFDGRNDAEDIILQPFKFYEHTKNIVDVKMSSDGSVVVFATDTDIFISNNGGKTFAQKQFTAELEHEGDYFSHILMNDTGEIILVFVSIGEQYLSYAISKDSGVTFEYHREGDINTATRGPFNCYGFVDNDANRLYVGCVVSDTQVAFKRGEWDTSFNLKWDTVVSESSNLSLSDKILITGTTGTNVFAMCYRFDGVNHTRVFKNYTSLEQPRFTFADIIINPYPLPLPTGVTTNTIYGLGADADKGMILFVQTSGNSKAYWTENPNDVFGEDVWVSASVGAKETITTRTHIKTDKGWFSFDESLTDSFKFNKFILDEYVYKTYTTKPLASGEAYLHSFTADKDGRVVYGVLNNVIYNNYAYPIGKDFVTVTETNDDDVYVEERQSLNGSRFLKEFNNFLWLGGYKNFVIHSAVTDTDKDNNPLYMPVKNKAYLGNETNEVTGFNISSDYDMVAYTKNNLWLISRQQVLEDLYDYVYTETRSDNGHAAKGQTIVTPLNEYPLQLNHKGFFVYQAIQNVLTSDKTSVLISNNINAKLLKTPNLQDAFFINHLYWTLMFVPDNNKTRVFVLDDRDSTWYYWEFNEKLVSVININDEIELTNEEGRHFTLETSDIINEFNPDVTEYYDDGKKLIEWFWKSQVLHLGTMNYSKKLVDTTFIVADTDMSDEYGLNYAYTAYRKMLSETSPTTITSKLNYVQSTTKRTMIPRFNFLQLKISNVDNDYNNNKLRLIGLGLKYVLLEGLLR